MKTKTDYGVIPLWVRADRKYVNRLKAGASLADMPLADYLRECLDFATEHKSNSFAADTGNNCSQNGNDKR